MGNEVYSLRCWRSTRDESNFSDAQKYAWDCVLHYKHIPVLNTDCDRAGELTKWVEPLFARIKELEAANALLHKKYNDLKERVA